MVFFLRLLGYVINFNAPHTNLTVIFLKICKLINMMSTPTSQCSTIKQKTHTYVGVKNAGVLKSRFCLIKWYDSENSGLYNYALRYGDTYVQCKVSLIATRHHQQNHQSFYFKVILCVSEHIYSIRRYCFRSFKQL